MHTTLFDTDKITLKEKVAVSEKGPAGKKSKKYLCLDGNCEGFFETLHHNLDWPVELANSNLDDVFNEFPECKITQKSFNILGEYYYQDKSIIYYQQSPDILEITKIHERFHAIHHLTVDDTNAIWDNFTEVAPFYQELLAQLFTYIFIKDNDSLLDTFEQLNQNQPFIYKTFKIFKHYDQSQAEDLYWLIRNNNKTNPLIIFLDNLAAIIKLKENIMRLEAIDNAVYNGIRKTINRFREQPFLYFTESDIHASLSKDIMAGNSDILVLGNTKDERTIIKTPVSLVHHEYPTNFRFKRDVLLNECDDENLGNVGIKGNCGGRGHYDLVVLDPNFIERLFESHKKDGLSEILKNIINKDNQRSVARNSTLDIIYAIEVKFIHIFNSGNKQMQDEVRKDNCKLKRAIVEKHCRKAINLVFCSFESNQSSRAHQIINNINKNIQDFQDDNILNIFIECHIGPNDIKGTDKPQFPTNLTGWMKDIKTFIIKR